MGDSAKVQFSNVSGQSSTDQAGQAGQPGDVQKPQGGENTRPEQPVLTLDAVKQLLETEVPRLVGPTVEKTFRGIQSMTQKRENRINQELNDLKSALKNAGVELNDSQSNALEQITRKKIMNENGQETGDTAAAQTAGQQQTAPGGQQSQTNSDNLITDMNDRANLLMEIAGVDLEESDPEAKLLEGIEDPKQWLSTLQTALENKKQRLNTSPEGRSFMGAGPGKPGNPLAGNYDLADLYSKGLSKLKS